MPAKIDIAGQKFSRLTVLRQAPNRNRYTMWHCRCDCGVEIVTYTVGLRSGNTNSCGCYKADRIREAHQKELTELWDMVDVRGPDECWPWKGALNSSGYGTFCGEGAHRVAFKLKHGKITEGMHVLHTCDFRPCCNPAHLFEGTAVDNGRDAWNKGRNFYQKNPNARPKGPSHKNAKLTAEQVREIRDLYENSPLDQYELAAQFGVSQRVISLVTRGESYKCV